MKRKIFFVIPYLAPPPFEERRAERIYRERRLISLSQECGFDARLFILSHEKEILKEEGDSNSWLIPSTGGKPDDPFSHVGHSLLKIVDTERPDILIIKGFGHKLTRWLLLHTNHRFRLVLIAAGGVKDPVGQFVDYVLAETEAQIQKSFLVQQAAGRVSILPKLNLPGTIPLSVPKEFDIVNVGTFNPNKNQQALLPLAKNYRLALVGDGECWNAVKEMAGPYGDAVFMPGNLPRDQVGPLIARSRLMVHAAQYEGLARVVMEAFAAGVPVVASRRAMPGAFEHGVQGILVEPHELLGAARELLEDRERLAAMGKAALEFANRHCTEEAVFTEVRKMYQVVFRNPPTFNGNWGQILQIHWRTAEMTALTVLRSLARALGIKRLLVYCGMRT